MKNALTLIELIFTVVILSVVFTLIPKIMDITTKTLERTANEEAIFNIMAQMSDIVFKEWDENNTVSDDILVVNQIPLPPNVLDCNFIYGYRIGGFKGSERNCKEDMKISHIGPDKNEPPYDDIDDYNGLEENTTTSGKNKKYYTIKMFASYVKEWKGIDYIGDSLNYQFSNTPEKKSNIKRVEVVVSHKVNGKEKNISTIKYYGANIGHSIIESVSW